MRRLFRSSLLCLMVLGVMLSSMSQGFAYVSASNVSSSNASASVAFVQDVTCISNDPACASSTANATDSAIEGTIVSAVDECDDHQKGNKMPDCQFDHCVIDCQFLPAAGSLTALKPYGQKYVAVDSAVPEGISFDPIKPPISI